MPPLRSLAKASVVLAFVLTACARPATHQTAPSPEAAMLAGSRQLVVVRTPGWDSTSGTLQRYVRSRADEAWRADGLAIPVVVGRSGLAWGGDEFGGSATEPH